MAFKMKRPFRMNGPAKSTLKFGKTDITSNPDAGGMDSRSNTDILDASSGIFYNSNMGPMRMVTPSALKQMEETETEETEVGYPEVDNRHGEEKAQHILGQEIQLVSGDDTESTEDDKYQIDTEWLGYGIGGIPEGIIEVLDPNGVLEVNDGFVADNDYTWELKDGKVIITGVR